MKKQLFGMILIVVASALGTAMSVSASEIFKLTLTIPAPATPTYPTYICGMDTLATDGLDGNYDSPIPSAPSSQLTVHFINSAVEPWLITDIRSPANAKTWQLDVSNLATGSSFNFNWTLTVGDAAFFNTNHASLLFKRNGLADVTIINAGTPVSTGTINITQNGSYYIVLQTGTNAQPSATADSAVTLKNQAVTIDVLANDTDPNKTDVLIISAADTASAFGGTVAIVNNKILYTPPAVYTGTYPFNDTFTYTVSDQFTGTGGAGTAVGTVTVQVADGAVATRSSAALAVTGSNYTITLNVIHNGTITNLKIDEFLPIADDVDHPWTYKTSSVSLAGVTVVQVANKVTFDFSTIPASPFVMTYQAVVPTTELTNATKTFRGSVYVNNSVTLTSSIPETSAKITSTHPADSNSDWKITQLEYVSYAGPVAAVFKRGINGGQYNWDGTTLTPVTTGSPVRVGYHPADTNQDGKITQLEYVTYAGPVAAVFKRGINGGQYTWNGTTLAPVTN